MACRVVCISSEDGTGGREIAQLVAAQLGFRLFDEDIVMRAAVDAGVDRAVVADVEKRKSLLVKVVEGMGPAGLGMGYAAPTAPESLGVRDPGSSELRGLIRSVIEETAATGEAVIVAHAASLALGEREDVLRVAVTASLDTRGKRLADELGVSVSDAKRTLKRYDANRADYIKRFYGIGEEGPTHYDIVINTDKLSRDDAVQLIMQAAGTGSQASVG